MNPGIIYIVADEQQRKNLIEDLQIMYRRDVVTPDEVLAGKTRGRNFRHVFVTYEAMEHDKWHYVQSIIEPGIRHRMIPLATMVTDEIAEAHREITEKRGQTTEGEGS
jgi:hypothetical protein